MAIRFAKGNHILAASGRHAAGGAITMSMPQADDRNICNIPSAKMNIYSHSQCSIQVNEGEKYRYHFFHVCVDFELCSKGNPAHEACS